MKSFSAVEIIVAKRDGNALSKDQIAWMIDQYTKGTIADEQMSALAMAILLNGMSRQETSELTQAMVASGEKLDFASLGIPTSDKHSTGGVGDKITLILTPLIACFGIAVPQLSGRGLGHTGGTLDKLESISGWNAHLSNTQMLQQLKDVGAVISAAGSGLTPADSKLYSLRDVTGTVESIPLIASSIMSKKIAEGTKSLVLDVKTGTGAFMKSVERSQELAQTLVAIGTDAGVATRALITDMNTPLGRQIGNALEVQEAIEVLSGGGPNDVIEITIALANEMLAAAGLPEQDVAEALSDGRALAKFEQLIQAQGGDLSKPLPVANESHTIYASSSGVLTELDALSVGIASWRLGAGRERKEDQVDHSAGITLHAQVGEQVPEGQALMTLHASSEDKFARAIEALVGSFKLSASAQRFERQVVLEKVQ